MRERIGPNWDAVVEEKMNRDLSSVVRDIGKQKEAKWTLIRMRELCTEANSILDMIDVSGQGQRYTIVNGEIVLTS